MHPSCNVCCLAQRHFGPTVEVQTACEAAVPAVGSGSGITVAVSTTTGCILGAAGEAAVPALMTLAKSFTIVAASILIP